MSHTRTVYMKQNDTAPDLQVEILDGDDNAVDVTGATVVFNMAGGGVPKVAGGSVTLVTAASGVVKYVWQSGDTDTPGVYEGEFQVTFVGGKVETYPNSDAGRLTIIIAKELG